MGLLQERADGAKVRRIAEAAIAHIETTDPEIGARIRRYAEAKGGTAIEVDCDANYQFGVMHVAGVELWRGELKVILKRTDA